MSDAPDIEIPDDLIDLFRAYDTARAEVEAYSATLPAGELAADQADELWRLRGVATAASEAVRHHPTMTEARAASAYWQTDQALRAAARVAVAA